MHPRAAPGDRLRVWLGAFDRSSPPDLEWRLGGQSARIEPVRPLAPAHSFRAASHTGVFDVLGTASEPVVPGRRYDLSVRAVGSGEGPTSLSVRSLPSAVTPGSPFNVLLCSCFHLDQDRTGRVGSTVSGLPLAHRPDLTLLVGDQVYLDLPTLQNFSTRESWLASKFERDYRANWGGNGDRGFAQVLRAAPSVSTPDDHEYWNNFPHRSPFVGNTWTESGRQSWRTAAEALLDAYQGSSPVGRGDPVEIDVSPLAFLVLDGRSERQADRSRSMSPGTLKRLPGWVDECLEEGRTGVVVTGQSLLDPPSGGLSGAAGDRALANYGDYAPVVQELARLADAGRPVVLLTGDRHWSRVASYRGGDGRLRFVEIISSPASLVTTVGRDPLRRLGAAIGSLFGRRDPWPRHSDPRDPPDYLARKVLGKRIRLDWVQGHRGDQVATLSFRPRAGRVELSVRFWPVRSGRPRPVAARTIRLGPA